MGDEIQKITFDKQDFEHFQQGLQAETELLGEWFKSGYFSATEIRAGYELEAWLVDEHFHPAAVNNEFFRIMDNPLVGPELAKFNVELNGTPLPVQGHMFSRFHREMSETWQACNRVAKDIDCQILMVGILPSVENEHLSLASMSDWHRYRALNREVLKRRKGRPLVFEINGVEHLKVTHRDVMLESAATSFQLHFQIPPELAVRVYNASLILSAPMVAISANSPFLFGKDLWDETRIPLFEMAVAVGGYDAAAFGPVRRVTFGSGYLRESLIECFVENMLHYPVLLPEHFDSPREEMRHVRLHNGTIWRWNRPLFGCEHQQPHLRLEHRVVSAGPSIIDEIANAALYFGAVYALACSDTIPESLLSFDKARDNFYSAARSGLKANLHWLDDKAHLANDLLLDQIVPLARQGLTALDIATADIQEYLSIIEARLASGINGTAWQRAYVNKHGHDMCNLVSAYIEHQQSQLPVHEWTI